MMLRFAPVLGLLAAFVGCKKEGPQLAGAPGAVDAFAAIPVLRAEAQKKSETQSAPDLLNLQMNELREDGTIDMTRAQATILVSTDVGHVIADRGDKRVDVRFYGDQGGDQGHSSVPWQPACRAEDLFAALRTKGFKGSRVSVVYWSDGVERRPTWEVSGEGLSTRLTDDTCVSGRRP